MTTDKIRWVRFTGFLLLMLAVRFFWWVADMPDYLTPTAQLVFSSLLILSALCFSIKED